MFWPMYWFNCQPLRWFPVPSHVIWHLTFLNIPNGNFPFWSFCLIILKSKLFSDLLWSHQYISFVPPWIWPYVKGIVSRDWAELEMILLNRSEVFNISASRFFYFCCRFRTVFLKMVAWAVLHFNIAHQRTTTAPGTQTVLRTAKKSCGECSPEFPGKLIPKSFIHYTVSVSWESFRTVKNQ